VTVEELDRALARIRHATAAARERLEVLVGELGAAREEALALLDTAAATERGSRVEAADAESKARQATSDADQVQVEVVFK
jgi:hypothetical protein